MKEEHRQIEREIEQLMRDCKGNYNHCGGKKKKGRETSEGPVEEKKGWNLPRVFSVQSVCVESETSERNYLLFSYISL